MNNFSCMLHILRKIIIHCDTHTIKFLRIDYFATKKTKFFKARAHRGTIAIYQRLNFTLCLMQKFPTLKTPVIKPRSEKHGYHAMILPRPYHGEYESPSPYHDAAVSSFLTMAVKHHGVATCAFLVIKK